MASAMASIVALKDVHSELKSRMEKSVDDFRANLASARTGRANVHMLDQIRVDYYGTDTPVSQMGQISVPEATLILVQPYDLAMVSAIEKAIRTSSNGLNPMTDGKVIRVTNRGPKPRTLKEGDFAPRETLAVALAGTTLEPGASTTAFVVGASGGSDHE